MKLGRKAVTEILKNKVERVDVTEKNISDYLGVARFRFGQVEADDQVRCRDGSGLDGSRRRAPDDRRRDDDRQGPHDGDWQPEGRDEGIDLGGGVLRPLAGFDFGVEPRSSTGATFTSTFPRVRPRRTVRRPALHGDVHRLHPHRHSVRADVAMTARSRCAAGSCRSAG